MQIVTVGEDRYEILGTVSDDNKNTEDMKRLYNADTVLKNDDTFYVCIKLIDAEFEMLVDEIDKLESKKETKKLQNKNL